MQYVHACKIIVPCRVQQKTISRDLTDVDLKEGVVAFGELGVATEVGVVAAAEVAVDTETSVSAVEGEEGEMLLPQGVELNRGVKLNPTVVAVGAGQKGAETQAHSSSPPNKMANRASLLRNLNEQVIEGHVVRGVTVVVVATHKCKNQRPKRQQLPMKKGRQHSRGEEVV